MAMLALESTGYGFTGMSRPTKDGQLHERERSGNISKPESPTTRRCSKRSGASPFLSKNSEKPSDADESFYDIFHGMYEKHSNSTS